MMVPGIVCHDFQQAVATHCAKAGQTRVSALTTSNANADTRRLPGGRPRRRARDPDGPRGVVADERGDAAGGAAARPVRALHAAGGQGGVRRVSGRGPAFRVGSLRQVTIARLP